MNKFDIILNHSKRKIVIHHTYAIGEDKIYSLLQADDLVFFDDCLYSQYLFLKKYNELLLTQNINCVLSFSTKIYRTTQKKITDVDSAILHDMVHNGNNDAYGGFMSLDEIQELLQYDNVFLAGHGANHIELNKICSSKIKQSTIFAKDIADMCYDLNKLNLITNIFVFPYAYDDFLCSSKIVKQNKFKYIFAKQNAYRISIENLLN